MVAVIHDNSRRKAFKPGSTGWTCDDIDRDPEVRWRWETGRYELIRGVVAAPGFGPAVATRLAPGSTGWSVADIESPPFDAEWERNRFELISGVIAEMPPPAFSHSFPVFELLKRLRDHFDEHGEAVRLASEVDLVIDESTDLIVDGVAVRAEQLEHARQKGWVGKLRQPPLLVIESVSLGHERHDYDTKRQMLEEFGVENYWVINAKEEAVLCLRRRDGRYVEEQATAGGVFTPAAFPGFSVKLADLFLS